MYPDDLKYHKEHTWVKISGEQATIGITFHAQEALGDIVYVDTPELESTVESGGELTQIESTKATSAVISPVGGTVVEFNEDLTDSPEIINEDPYANWIAVIDIEDDTDIDNLMNADEYKKYLDEEVK